MIAGLSQYSIMNRIQCFKPLVDREAQIIILGTMPGEKSLIDNFYYGNPKNHFWDILFRILEPEHDFYELASTKSIDEKRRLLLNNRIGLWDVIESCERKGSNDSKINNEILNDFTKFFRLYPAITTVYFNGRNAREYFQKRYSEVDFENIEFHQLNSTSTSNPNNTFGILTEWKSKLKK